MLYFGVASTQLPTALGDAPRLQEVELALTDQVRSCSIIRI